MKLVIFGGSRVPKFSEPYNNSFNVVKRVSKYCSEVITGGYSGIMEASNKAAIKNGVISTGVVSSAFTNKEVAPNEFLNKVINSSGLINRLQYIRDNSDIAVALEGEAGTLHEILTLVNLYAIGEIFIPMMLLESYWKPIFDNLIEMGVLDCDRVMPYIQFGDEYDIVRFIKDYSRVFVNPEDLRVG